MTEPTTTQPARPLVIAIDGPAGAGKSTIARMLADRLGLPYLDTGAMYRAVALLALRAGVRAPLRAADEDRLAGLANGHQIEVTAHHDGARVFIDREDVSDAIRSPECSAMASAVSAVSAVRQSLVPLQRAQAARSGGVLEGRDIGSVVVPDADLKVFLTASAAVRAQRRCRDLAERGIAADLESVRSEQAQRDLQDTSRADSPLLVARGSVVIDTTQLGLEGVVERIVAELEATRTKLLDTPGRTP